MGSQLLPRALWDVAAIWHLRGQSAWGLCCRSPRCGCRLGSAVPGPAEVRRGRAGRPEGDYNSRGAEGPLALPFPAPAVVAAGGHRRGWGAYVVHRAPRREAASGAPVAPRRRRAVTLRGGRHGPLWGSAAHEQATGSAPGRGAAVWGGMRRLLGGPQHFSFTPVSPRQVEVGRAGFSRSVLPGEDKKGVKKASALCNSWWSCGIGGQKDRASKRRFSAQDPSVGQQQETVFCFCLLCSRSSSFCAELFRVQSSYC